MEIRTVKDLKKALKGKDDSLQIIMSSDPEGNNFATLDKDFDVGKFAFPEADKKALVFYPFQNIDPII